MDHYLSGMRDFWEERFLSEGMVWGERPSATADYALGLFKERNVRDILVPGAGYGRNTKLFSMHGYRVTGIEISDKAVYIAKQFDPDTVFVRACMLEAEFTDQSFDAIFCFNTLHLFRKTQRLLFVSKCYDWLRTSGCCFFTAFSMEEPSFGKGRKVEENTFESRPGRPAHYFSDEDLRDHFSDFSILETGIMEDPEDHGEEGAHIHRVAYIFASKPPV